MNCYPIPRELRILFLLTATLVTALATSIAHASVDRPVIDLDGVWQFATDPDEVGEADHWYRPGQAWPKMPRAGYAATADGRITVPGAWETQGYGEPTEFRFHRFLGQGWYKRTVTVPENWANKGVFLKIGGIHRQAKIWVNGVLVGEHIGFLSELEYDVSAHLSAGQEAVIVVRVDARQNTAVDPFNGTSSGVELEGKEWGGIWGHVSLDARPEVYLENVFVQTVSINEPMISVTGNLGGESFERVTHAQVEVADATGEIVTTAELKLRPFMQEEGAFHLKLPVVGAKLWSPDQPALYTARVSIIGEAGPIDVLSQQFGVREFLIEGENFMLNGDPVFMASAGDDNVYPNNFGALYVSKDKLVARMQLMKSYGFNAVRTHSSVMSPDFYAACDEVGMLVRPEMPFSGTHKLIGRMKNSPRAYDTTKSEFTNAVIRLRNHPSIYAWSGGNELFSYTGMHRFPHGSQVATLMVELQAILSRYHPGAYFVDNLNTYTARAQMLDQVRDLSRDTVDFISPNSHHAGDPYGNRGFSVVRPLQPKPIIIHESHDRATFPRLAARHEFTRGIVPYWLDEMAAYYERLGLIDETTHWERVSEELVMDNLKLETEAIRLQGDHVGYDFWLFQDFWATANGLVDYLLTPKPGIPADKFRNFNNDVVLLKTGLDVTYRGGESLNLEYYISNYGADEISDARLEVIVTLADKVIQKKTLPAADAGQGEVSPLGAAKLMLPDVTQPSDMAIQVRLRTDQRVLENDWTARVYPRNRTTVNLAKPVFTLPKWLNTFASYAPQSVPESGPLSSRAIYLVNALDERLIQVMADGATVVLIQPENELLPLHHTYGWRAVFWSVKPHRMLRSVGHLVYDHPLTRRITNEDGLQHEWFHLLENATPFILDDMPAQPEVMMRAIEGAFSMVSKALMFEAKVGQGVLLASGLNHLATPDRPENQWVMDQMLNYVAGAPEPTATISTNWLRERLAVIAATSPEKSNP